MDITAFIRELLFSHDCVIVPGFGGFIGNYTPARIDKSTSTFFPPVKQISFNRNLNHNDGLLIGRISESAGINYADSRNLVEEYVASVRKKLERGDKVVFYNIGSFISSQEGTVQFEPDTSVNYHLDSYGLESFQFQPVEGYDIRTRISRHIDPKPSDRRPLRKVLWRAAVIIPLMAVVVAVSLKSDLLKSKVEATTLNPLASAEFENSKAAEESAVSSPAENIKTSTEIIPAVTPAAEESGVFYIITGSFRSRQNAESQASQLKKDGFAPEILNASNGFFRVSIMKCTNLPAALDQKDKFLKDFPGSWVKKF